jgi:hypothetical protein
MASPAVSAAVFKAFCDLMLMSIDTLKRPTNDNIESTDFTTNSSFCRVYQYIMDSNERNTYRNSAINFPGEEGTAYLVKIGKGTKDRRSLMSALVSRNVFARVLYSGGICVVLGTSVLVIVYTA